MKAEKWSNLIVCAVIFAIWEILSRVFDRSFFPGAIESFSAMFRLIKEGTLLEHLWASTYRILLGTIFGLVAAIPVGLFMGKNKPADKYLGTAFHVL